MYNCTCAFLWRARGERAERDLAERLPGIMGGIELSTILTWTAEKD